jgi:flagellar basal body rod protein FlgC
MNHITDILDNTPFAELTESDLSTISTHAANCGECADAFATARISSMLLRERVSLAADNTANANPFFQTRVLAAWREQQAGAAWSLRRLWNATGTIVASMAATTAALAVLMFVAPAANTTDQQTASLVPYSAETVVLEQDRDDNQMTNDQVISAIYDDDDEGK